MLVAWTRTISSNNHKEHTIAVLVTILSFNFWNSFIFFYLVNMQPKSSRGNVSVSVNVLCHYVMINIDRSHQRGRVAVRQSHRVLAPLWWCSWPAVSDLVETWADLPVLSLWWPTPKCISWLSQNLSSALPSLCSARWVPSVNMCASQLPPVHSHLT